MPSRPTNFSDCHVYLQTDEDDAAAVGRCLGGDTNAFDALVARHERVLFRVALRMLGDAEDARDATQTAFVKAFEQLHRYDPGFRFFSWIYRILANECLNRRRDRRPMSAMTDVAAVDGPFEALEQRERQRRVQAALLDLAAPYREVVVLRHFSELSYEEMAVTLAIPVKTVKSRLYTARQQLGARLFGWM